ncbi:MAG: hypothetical protein KKH98_01090 [Spirochaetes bacterium]|nr:hypothetical protein [Spirochaetota bacterium]
MLFITRMVLFLVLLFLTAVHCNREDQADDQLKKVVLCDKDVHFQTNISYGKQRQYILSIERKTIEMPIYDGLSGYNLFLIRKYTKDLPHQKRDEYTEIIKGQYRLMAYNDRNKRLYAFRIFQDGAVFSIRNINVIDIKRKSISEIGPVGSFQYASVDPAGEKCLLVNDRITVVDLISGSHYALNTRVEENAANPWIKNRVGGGYNLSGEYMNISWENKKNALLTVKNAEGVPEKKIKIILE